jgi:hypothetical protein
MGIKGYEEKVEKQRVEMGKRDKGTRWRWNRN